MITNFPSLISSIASGIVESAINASASDII
jgi:hypothetical protein